MCLSTRGSYFHGDGKGTECDAGGREKVKAQRVLEINASHPISAEKLVSLFGSDQDNVKKSYLVAI